MKIPGFPLADVPSVLLFVAGFSCKSLSAQNNNAHVFGNCLFARRSEATHRKAGHADTRCCRPAVCKGLRAHH